MKDMWREFRIDLIEYLKISAIIIGLILLFVIAASAASPLFAAFDAVTGYGI